MGHYHPGSIMSTGDTKPNHLKTVTLNLSEHPILKYPIEILKLDIPPKGTQLHFEIRQCEYHNMPYLFTSHQKSFWYQQVNSSLRHNVWILTVGNNDPITENQVYKDIEKNQLKCKTVHLQFVVSKRDSVQTKTSIDRHWAAFEQMAPFIKKKKSEEQVTHEEQTVPTVTNVNDKSLVVTTRRSVKIRDKVYNPKTKK